MRVFVGTSGWNYPHWRRVFYPPGLCPSRWLAYYAERFPAVEVNNPFYRIPAPEAVARWAAAVPQGFRFAVKLWRGITHYRKLKAPEDFLRRYAAALAPVPRSRRGVVLVQLPPRWGPDLKRLDAFLELLPAHLPPGWRVAVEFREEAWLRPATYELLTRRGAALCLHDYAGHGAARRPNDVDLVYVRRHGPAGPYAGCYTHRQLAGDARRIRTWLAEGREVYVFFNNDVGGHAVRNARDLLARLAGS